MRKKIAIICEWAGIIHRGGESCAIELGNYLQQYYDIDLYTRGNSVDNFSGHVCTIDSEASGKVKKWGRFFDNSSVVRKFVQCSRYTMLFLPNYIKSYEWGKKVFKEIEASHKYDLIYPVTGPSCHILARKYRKQYKVPFIGVGGGGIGPGEWWVLKTQPDKYVCISSDQYLWAKQYYDNLVQIPNGTYVDMYSMNEEIDKYIINTGNKLIVSAGHLDTEFKRHQLAIQAVSLLNNADLLILGAGEAKKEFEELGERLMPGRLKVMSVPHSEIAYYYKSADCFTLPSIGEPFGVVYIEAMAAGVPCVGTDDLTRREIIGNAGYVCDVENSQEYANTLEKAINTNWGDSPRMQAEKFDYSVIGEKYYNMIEELIHGAEI